MVGGNRADSRAALLAAASHEFAAFGPQGARIQAIVERAGVNERMIYHHFGSKDGLYRAVLEEQWYGVAAAWSPVLHEAARLEPRAGLQLAFAGLLRAFLQHPLLPALAIHEALSGWQAAPSASLSSIPPELRQLFEHGQATGVFAPERKFEVLYLTVVSTLSALTITGPRFVELRDDFVRDPSFAERLGEQMIELVLDGASLAPG